MNWSKETQERLDRIEILQQRKKEYKGNEKEFQDLVDQIQGLVNEIPAKELFAYRRKNRMQYYVEENRVPDKQKVILSPSGTYRLVVDQYRTCGPDPNAKQRSWNYSRGQIIKVMTSEVIETVYRNYPSFWYCFVEHPNGCEYLFCGEDYQGYDLVNLSTGERRSTLQDNAFLGWGWCTANMVSSPNGKYIVADGCYWACPYDLRVLDFSNPENFPLPILTTLPDGPSFKGWDSEDSFLYQRTWEGQETKDGTFYIWEDNGWKEIDPKEREILDWRELSEEEYDKMEEEHPERLGYRIETHRWHPRISQEEDPTPIEVVAPHKPS